MRLDVKSDTPTFLVLWMLNLVFLGISNIFMIATALVIHCCWNRKKHEISNEDKLAKIMQLHTFESNGTETRENNKVKQNNYINIRQNTEQESSPLIIDLPVFYEDLQNIYNSEDRNERSLLKSWKNFVLKYQCVEVFLYNNKNPMTLRDEESNSNQIFLDSITKIKEIQDSIFELCGYYKQESYFQQDQTMRIVDENSYSKDIQTIKRKHQRTYSHNKNIPVVTPMSNLINLISRQELWLFVFFSHKILDFRNNVLNFPLCLFIKPPKKNIEHMSNRTINHINAKKVVTPKRTFRRAIKLKSVSFKAIPNRIVEILNKSSKEGSPLNQSESCDSSIEKSNSRSSTKRSNLYSESHGFEPQKINNFSLKDRVEGSHKHSISRNLIIDPRIIIR
ncbi:unnamed protein product [Moneuplotes crassus]|uniref:Uncharacterized protein n=1 Tax=Euplotes crassus TaxID=5936 RepID=A0AAD1UD14_EUPCR|nr:unnamed protein product [Moneuplotes crassus]